MSNLPTGPRAREPKRDAESYRSTPSSRRDVSSVPVSILIPTWQRPVELARCLHALRQEIAPHRGAELLTVHAPGDEATEAMVAAEHPEVSVLRARERNLSLQRNHGAQHARGDVIVYLDDDAWPKPGWLDALLQAFANPRVAAVGGRVLRGDGSLQYGAMAVTRSGRPFVLADGAEPPPGTARTLPGGNLAVRRDVLFALGGFDENIAYHFDDVDFSLRLWSAGLVTVYRADAAIFHEPAPGPHRRTFWDRDWYTIAQNSIYLALCHTPPRTRWRLLRPLCLQLPKSARFLAWLLSGKLPPRAFARAMAGQWQGIVAGYRKGLRQAPRLPLRAAATSARTHADVAALVP